MKDQMNIAALSAAARGDLANAIVAMTPGGIEAQEAEGQRRLAANFRTLPKDMDRDIAQAFGFTFGDDVDELFVNVTAPVGWAIVPTEHSMHSDIVDDAGRNRGSIFYKAAFYDRRADGRWLSRYRVEHEYTPQWASKAVFARDASTGDILYRQEVPEGGETDYAVYSKIEKEVAYWLSERFPDYQNPAAYWPQP